MVQQGELRVFTLNGQEAVERYVVSKFMSDAWLRRQRRVTGAISGLSWWTAVVHEPVVVRVLSDSRPHLTFWAV